MKSLPRLLVTGGSGYLGTHVVARAEANRQWETWALYFQRPPVRSSTTQWCCIDLLDRAAVLDLFRRIHPQVVIHTAYGGSREHDVSGVTVAGSRNVAEAAAKIGARLIHLSSDSVFDGESSPYSDDEAPWPVTPYGQAKAASEWHILAAGPLDRVIVRTSLIVGLIPMDPHLAWIVRSLKDNEAITLYTDEYRCPIWARDLADALLELASSDYRGVLNVAGPEGMSRYDLGVKIAEWAGLDPAEFIPGITDRSKLLRPRDLVLDVSRAKLLLRTPLHSISEGLTTFAYASMGM